MALHNGLNKSGLDHGRDDVSLFTLPAGWACRCMNHACCPTVYGIFPLVIFGPAVIRTAWRCAVIIKGLGQRSLIVVHSSKDCSMVLY